jgi:DNA-binding protein H-NS
MDLTAYSLSQLRQLAQQVAAELEIRQSQLITKAREDIEAIAKGVGMTAAALMKLQDAPATSKVPRPPRYANPDDAAQTWSGVGKPPKWVRRHTEAGGLLEALRIVERK